MTDNEPASTTSHGDTSRRLSEAEREHTASKLAGQAKKLAHNEFGGEESNVAIRAQFVTPNDPVIVTSDGNRMPGVPLEEAHKLNALREEAEGVPETVEIKQGDETQETITNTKHGEVQKHKTVDLPPNKNGLDMQKSGGGTLKRQQPPSHTNPLFPPLPLYGPPSRLRDMQCFFFRISSFFLSLGFLMAIVLGAMFTSIPGLAKKTWYALTYRNIDEERPFYEEEQQRQRTRKERAKAWKKNRSTEALTTDAEDMGDEFVPTEGGKDPIICDVGYYARRVGLDVEPFKVQTEDGFIIDLWHVYDPKEYVSLDSESRDHLGPQVFEGTRKKLKDPNRKPKFPVLLMHGLLQSSGAYCCNDDDSLAFWLCKSGYDVWLGNNRCGFEPKHAMLKYGDPRMWCWNIRQMGVFDLPALVSRVLFETRFEKIGLICHSQGTTQALVALAKEQRPDIGEKLTVFCALAPAAYAGPLIGKMYFRFMRIISPGFFRIMFGIHAFIPLMMQMHELLPPTIYGWLGYKVFSFLFNWSDTRWDRGLRDRMFQFAPVYVSAESMRWWLGRECFANHKCILATKEAVKEEEREEEQIDDRHKGKRRHGDTSEGERQSPGQKAWYNSQAPPFALWVCGKDDLVDGAKLVRRLRSGREPYVDVVHSKTVDEYEHLDVIWAMDAKDQVFGEVREVLWKTAGDARGVCRVPVGCESVEEWKRDTQKDEVGVEVTEDESGQSSGSAEGRGDEA
ncbi:alpha/beta-hydrolase [Sarocladium strictum]